MPLNLPVTTNPLDELRSAAIKFGNDVSNFARDATYKFQTISFNSDPRTLLLGFGAGIATIAALGAAAGAAPHVARMIKKRKVTSKGLKAAGEGAVKGATGRFRF